MEGSEEDREMKEEVYGSTRGRGKMEEEEREKERETRRKK